jgi:hypothetical protein
MPQSAKSSPFRPSTGASVVTAEPVGAFAPGWRVQAAQVNRPWTCTTYTSWFGPPPKPTKRWYAARVVRTHSAGPVTV